jgi:hypothetical protein
MRPVAVVMVDVDAEHLLKLSARALIEEIVEGVQALGDSLLEHAAPGLLDDFAGAYGVEPATLWAEVLHQLHLRLRSIGFSHVGRESSFTLRP